MRAVPRTIGPRRQPRRPAWFTRKQQTGTPDRPRWESRAQTFGSLATGIAAVTALIFTQSQLAITEQGQISDRFGRAVEQLASSTLDVRLGGIYALEQVMRDSQKDQPTVVEVLSAFVRTHAGLDRRTRRSSGSAKSEISPAVDIQAVLTVLRRRDPDHDRYARVDLSHAALNGADLEGTVLRDANLDGTQLSGADLSFADLSGASLNGTKLVGAELVSANLTDADLRKADLRDADLSHANLTGADLEGADTRDTDQSCADPGFEVLPDLPKSTAGLCGSD